MIIRDNIYVNADTLGRKVTELCNLFTYKNPEYYKKKALKLSVKNVSATFIHYRMDASTDGRTLVLPRGGLERVKKFYSDNNLMLRISDERITHPLIDCSLDPTTVLESQQNQIIDVLMENEGGLIQMDVAGGKTISALGFISKIKQPTLILFNRHQLKQQWFSEIYKRLNGNFILGDYSEGNFVHGDIVLGLVQTIHTMVDKDPGILDRFGALIIDECLDGDTMVSIPGGLKRLSAIKKGELVLTPRGATTKVLAVRTVKKKAYKYNIAGGLFLIASSDHKVPAFDYETGKISLKKIKDVSNFMILKRPYKKGFNSSFDEGLYSVASVLTREELGERKLIDITIADKDHLFIANGIAVSNCHRMSSDTYLKITNRVSAKYRVGFTATVERKDQLHFLIFDELGPIKIDITASDLKHRITSFDYEMVYTNISHKFPLRKRWTGQKKEDVRDYTALLSLLVGDDERNELILLKIRSYIKHGYYVLVMSDRVAHSRFLHKTISSEGYSAELIVTKSRNYDWDSIRNNKDLQVIFATTSMVAEGMDLPRLSALFLTCPSSNMPQLKQKLGRVRRQCDDKPTPIVVDFVDNNIYDRVTDKTGEEKVVYPMRVSASKRAKFYKKLLEEYHSKDKANERDLQGSISPEQEI